MQTVTFYSYKGGVGRSLTLSNMAKKLLEYDVDVFVIDFDLEAPGLTYKFTEEIKGTIALEKQGLVDYINYFQDHSKLPERLSDYYTELKSTKGGKGKLYLMTAGQFKRPDYWDKLSAINWVKLFEKDGDGVPLLLDLKGRIKKELKPQVLLIDSRTGVTASASITLKLLADKCVILAVNNDENLEGANVVLHSLASLDKEIRPELSFVLTRIPFHNKEKAEQTKERAILKSIKEQYFKSLDIGQLKYFGVIHHEREQGWKEEHRLGLPQEKKDFLTLDYLQLFESLFSSITKKEKLRKEKLVAELLEKAETTKNTTEKISYYTKALSFDPENRTALLKRSLSFRDLRNWDQAIKDVVTATKINPSDSLPYAVYGIVLIDFGRSEKSERHLNMALNKAKKAIGMDPDFYMANHVYGIALATLAEFKEGNEADALLHDAVKQLNHTIGTEPSNQLGYTGLAAVLLKIAKNQTGKESEKTFKLALEKINISIKLGGDNYNLACYYAIKREKNKALSILEESLKKGTISPKYVDEDDDWVAFKDDSDFRHLLDKYRDVSNGQ